MKICKGEGEGREEERLDRKKKERKGKGGEGRECSYTCEISCTIGQTSVSSHGEGGGSWDVSERFPSWNS
jgi:hypothetical protein